MWFIKNWPARDHDKQLKNNVQRTAIEKKELDRFTSEKDLLELQNISMARQLPHNY